MDYLERNLLAIERLYPTLAERICDAIGATHVLVHDEGRVDCIHGLSSYEVNLGAADCSAQMAASTLANENVLFGAGLGELVIEALERGPANAVWHVWDDDPWMWRETLKRFELRPHIFSGRLKPYLGLDLVSHRTKLASLPIVQHPILGHLYRWHLDYLRAAPKDKRCLLCDGELFVEDLARTLKNRGYEIYPWATSRLSMQEVKRTLESFSPSLVMAVNFRRGLAEVSELTTAPVVCWEIDPAVDLVPRAPEQCSGLSIFTYRRAHVKDFQDRGYKATRFLPLATNPGLRHPLREAGNNPSPYRVPVSFVGASMLDQGRMLLREFVRVYATLVTANAPLREPAELEDILERIVSTQRQDLSCYQVGTLLYDALPELRAPGPGELDPEKMVSEICAAHKRMDWLSALSPRPLAVWGDAGWKECPAVEYKGAAGHGQELTLIYSNSQINVDIGRLYQNDIMTMRLFDVMACEGFLLTEHSEELERWFTPGVHLDTYRTPVELAEKIDYYLANPEQARTIGKAARERILESHTFDKRLDDIFSSISL